MIQIGVLLTYILMIIVNALANILPINGIGSGEVSDSYPNLFAPAGSTFAIWGVIYLLLGLYTLFQLGLMGKYNKAFNKIGIFMIATSLINSLWIFAWHYDFILVSLLLIVGLLSCLIFIHKEMQKHILTKKEVLFIKVPFNIYFGWITIATIANATTFLVSVHWSGWGIQEETWTVIMLIIGLLIAIRTILKYQMLSYGFVIIWAYYGIFLKHTSVFNSQYPTVINTTLAGIALILITLIYLFYTQHKKAS